MTDDYRIMGTLSTVGVEIGSKTNDSKNCCLFGEGETLFLLFTLFGFLPV
jgi:hypothetical protein